MKKYYYIKNNNRFGPFTNDELKNESLFKNTKIWYEGIDDWTELYKIDELSNLIFPPPLPNDQRVTKYLKFSKFQVNFLITWVILLISLFLLTKTENSEIYNYTISSKSRIWPFTSEFYATKTKNHPTLKYNCVVGLTGEPCFYGFLADFDFTEVLLYSLIPIGIFIYKNEK